MLTTNRFFSKLSKQGGKNIMIIKISAYSPGSLINLIGRVAKEGSWVFSLIFVVITVELAVFSAIILDRLYPKEVLVEPITVCIVAAIGLLFLAGWITAWCLVYEMIEREKLEAQRS